MESAVTQWLQDVQCEAESGVICWHSRQLAFSRHSPDKCSTISLNCTCSNLKSFSTSNWPAFPRNAYTKIRETWFSECLFVSDLTALVLLQLPQQFPTSQPILNWARPENPGSSCSALPWEQTLLFIKQFSCRVLLWSSNTVEVRPQSVVIPYFLWVKSGRCK